MTRPITSDRRVTFDRTVFFKLNLFLRLPKILRLKFYQNKTGFEKGKATLSKSGYIYVGKVETVRIADEADYADCAD